MEYNKDHYGLEQGLRRIRARIKKLFYLSRFDPARVIQLDVDLILVAVVVVVVVAGGGGGAGGRGQVRRRWLQAGETGQPGGRALIAGSQR